MSSRSSDNWILYDGDCPFCSNYVALLRLRETLGPFRILNARDEGPEVRLARKAGLDLDEGMALHYDGELYHGAECIHLLSLLSEERGVANRLMAWTFSSKARASFFYPFLRAGRNVTLKLLGRSKIGVSKAV